MSREHSTPGPPSYSVQTLDPYSSVENGTCSFIEVGCERGPRGRQEVGLLRQKIQERGKEQRPKHARPWYGG